MRGTGWSSVFDAVVCLGVGCDGGVWWWFYLETHVGERTGELLMTSCTDLRSRSFSVVERSPCRSPYSNEYKRRRKIQMRSQ
jgi:hypothetical protein